MSVSDPNPHADPNTPSDALTPMEAFFDTLFNQHMVLPQPREDAAPIVGVEDHDLARDGQEADSDRGLGD